MNDLWSFDLKDPEMKWRWVRGSKTPNAVAVSGSVGIASDSFTPDAVYGAAFGQHKTSKEVFVFGGEKHLDAAPIVNNGLWKFIPASERWSRLSAIEWNQDSKWNQGSSAGPGSRIFSALAVDYLNNQIYLAGGDGYTSGGRGN